MKKIYSLAKFSVFTRHSLLSILCHINGQLVCVIWSTNSNTKLRGNHVVKISTDWKNRIIRIHHIFTRIRNKLLKFHILVQVIFLYAYKLKI